MDNNNSSTMAQYDTPTAAKVAKMSACVDMEGGPCSSKEDDLFDAINKNDLDAAYRLITQTDVDVNKVNCRHKTMLSRSVEQEHVPMVELLLKNGANINTSSFSGHCFSFETPIMTAARLENEELVDLLLSWGCELDNVQGKGGKTALQWLATYGNLRLMKLLHQAGADVNFCGPFLHTALHYATIANQTEAVVWLLDQGAEITANGERRTPLHIACAKGSVDIAKYLFRAKPVLNDLDSFGFTPFSLACLQGHLEIVQFMMENHKLSPPGFDLDDGLLRASEVGHVEVLEYLIGKGANVNALNKSNESALSIASRGQPKSVELLIQNNAIINIVDQRGYTPLQEAIIRKQANVAIMLIKHGAHLQTCSPAIDSPLRSSYNISDPILIKFLIMGGCNLSREWWLTADAIKTKLRELDFQYNPLHYRQCIDVKRETWQWIIKQTRQPQSLMELSRVAIRKQMVVASGNRSICSNINCLPMPTAMKVYISMEDFWQ